MWRLLNDYFCFTKKERHGIIYIVFIIAALIFLPFLFPYFSKKESIDTSKFEKEIAQLQIDSSSKKIHFKFRDEYENDVSPSDKYGSEKKVELFYFDPNTASVNDWVRLGIREKTAKTIQKYILKGGRFKKPED
jgi:competence protein ComEA